MTTAKNSEFSISLILVVGLLIVVGLVYLFIFVMAEDGFGKNMQRVNAAADSSLTQRIKPVVTLSDILGNDAVEEQSEQPIMTAKSAQSLYDGACLACHSTGVAGAPKLGDKAAWEPRYAVGIDVLLSSSITGKGAMPPNGASAYSEAEMKTVIEFMLAEAGLIEASTDTVAEQAAPAPASAPVATNTDVAIPADAQTTDQMVASQQSAPAMDLAAGEQAYRVSCFACHDAGVAGAPKLGDKAAWAPRISTGFDTLLKNSISGKGAMPPKGGAVFLRDSEMANVVAFMVERAK